VSKIWFKISASVLVLVSLAFSGGSAASDWPMYDHDLANTGYTDSPAPRFPNLLWEVFIHCTSSPVVVENKLYVVGQENHPAPFYTENHFLFAFNVENGDLIWKFNLGGGASWWSVSTPSVVDGRVYVGTTTGYVYAVDSETGKEIWRFHLGNSTWSSSVVYSGRVYIGADDNFVYALNAENGDLIWKFKTGGEVWSTPAVDNGVVYVSSGDGCVYALNAENGLLLWSRKIASYLGSSPTVIDGKVYVGIYGRIWPEENVPENGGIYALDAENGDIIWSYNTRGDVEQSVAVVENRVYGVSQGGDIFALDAENGERIWEYYEGNFLIDFTSPVVADNKVFVEFASSKLYCINAENGMLAWSTEDVIVSISTTPAIVNGKLFYASNGLYAFGTPPPTIEPQNEVSGTTTLRGTAWGKDLLYSIVFDPSLKARVQVNWGEGWENAEVNFYDEGTKTEFEFDPATGKYIPISTENDNESGNLSARYIVEWEYPWNTENLPDGEYQVRVRIFYGQLSGENVYSDETVITLFVNNTKSQSVAAYAMILVLVSALVALGCVKWLKKLRNR